jgi:hypothetical protein
VGEEFFSQGFDQDSYSSDWSLLDEGLSAAFSTCRTLAPLMRESDFNAVERAVIQLVPTSLSIAASIRELLRERYVPSAKILVRPLLERTAVLDYLVNEPEAIKLWDAGWPHRKRPRLATLIARMTGTSAADETLIQQMIVDDFNSVVHADPQGSEKFVFQHPEHGKVYSFGRTVGSEGMADNVAAATAMAATFLASNAKRAFRTRFIKFAESDEVEATQRPA